VTKRERKRGENIGLMCGNIGLFCVEKQVSFMETYESWHTHGEDESKRERKRGENIDLFLICRNIGLFCVDI